MRQGKALAFWFRSKNVRRTFAVSALVLASGGLVLYRADASAAPFGTSVVSFADGKNSSSFKGPGLHGVLSLSHTSALSGATTPVYAELRVAADPAERVGHRAPIAMAIVLDTSGSMGGDKIADAKTSCLRLLSDMRDEDQVSFVRYSDTAEVIQPLARVGVVRRELVAKIRGLEAGGGTNIPAGLGRGMATLDEGGVKSVRRIVLVSDGLDNTRSQAETLAQSSFRQGVTVSALGIGLDFDESYMGGVAQNGHGNFAFVKEGSSIATFLKQELEETSLTSVENAHVRLELPSGMSFVSAVGAEATRSDREIDLNLGSLFAGDERRVIVELRAQDPGTIAATASWRQVNGSTSDVTLKPLSLLAANDASEVDRGKDGAVFASVTSVLASQRQLEAASAWQAGDVARAQALTTQNQVALGAALSAAPPAAAATIQAQLSAYDEEKRNFAAVPPSSPKGKAAAKAAAVQDRDNLSRSSKKF